MYIQICVYISTLFLGIEVQILMLSNGVAGSGAVSGTVVIPRLTVGTVYTSCIFCIAKPRLNEQKTLAWSTRFKAGEHSYIPHVSANDVILYDLRSRKREENIPAALRTQLHLCRLAMSSRWPRRIKAPASAM